MKKNKEKTKEKILNSISAILLRDGFKKIGINSIADEAGVDKVLIYRYFGGLDGVLKAFADREDVFSASTEQVYCDAEMDRNTQPSDVLTSFLLNEMKNLRIQPLAQEIMAWDLFEENSVTQKLTDEADDRMMSTLYGMMTQYDPPEGVDLMAVMGLLRGAINYLYVRSRTRSEFFGIDVSSDEGWRRVEHAVERIIQKVMG